jgi:hypothetical protein
MIDGSGVLNANRPRHDTCQYDSQPLTANKRFEP